MQLLRCLQDIFLDEIKEELLEKDGTFTFYNYAFIISRSNQKDTVYADTALKSWIYEDNGNH